MLKTLRAYFSRVFRGRAPLWYFFFSFPHNSVLLVGVETLSLFLAWFFFTSSSLAERKKNQVQLKSRVRLIWLHDSSQTQIKKKGASARKKLTHYGIFRFTKKEREWNLLCKKFAGTVFPPFVFVKCFDFTLTVTVKERGVLALLQKTRTIVILWMLNLLNK